VSFRRATATPYNKPTLNRKALQFPEDPRDSFAGFCLNRRKETAPFREIRIAESCIGLHPLNGRSFTCDIKVHVRLGAVYGTASTRWLNL